MSRIEAIAISELASFASPDVRYIYVIHEAGDLTHCKIGRARHPEWRRVDLQSGNHRRLVLSHAWIVPSRNSAAVFERAIHSKLAAALVAGEWFRVAPEVAARVANQTFLEFEI